MDKEKKVKTLRIMLDYPKELGLPCYCNFVQIRFTSNEYLFDFAFVDAKDIKDDMTDESLVATVTKRVCMSHNVAEQFFEAFKENLEKFKTIQKELNKEK